MFGNSTLVEKWFADINSITVNKDYFPLYNVLRGRKDYLEMNIRNLEELIEIVESTSNTLMTVINLLARGREVTVELTHTTDSRDKEILLTEMVSLQKDLDVMDYELTYRRTRLLNEVETFGLRGISTIDLELTVYNCNTPEATQAYDQAINTINSELQRIDEYQYTLEMSHDFFSYVYNDISISLGVIDKLGGTEESITIIMESLVAGMTNYLLIQGNHSPQLIIN